MYATIKDKFNFNYTGIEPNKEGFTTAYQRYNQNNNFSIINDFAENALSSITKVDAVIALETLEHIPENIVVRIVEKIAELKPKLFICSVPIEVGPIIWVKNIGSLIMGYHRNQEYSAAETFYAGIGKLDKLPPHGTGHKGFDYRWLMQTIRHNFQITKINTFPFNFLPYGLSTSVFMQAKPRNNTKNK